ncbi:protein let-653-like isoform X2 [Pecten maximus]|uniref:protein let-653-like isoform X2 n=1 Tax=Pecten maximus TaxID=6579 RepID=UPI001458E7F8|nr:protein let-653-like isoform X2 [Pecten maximus]
MDKVTIGSGKLLIDKKGKLLVQGDDKVASSNPNESHQLITRTNPDGSSNLYMVPSEGVNKGKFFLVMPENNTGKQDIPSNDLSSNKVSKPLPENSTFPNSLEPKWEAPGSQCLSTVLKNIANHISSESKASEDVKLLKSNSIPSSNHVPTEVESPASVSSFVLTGASIIDHSSANCESQVNQEHDVKSSTNLSVIEPKPYVIQGTSSIPGNSLTVPSVGTIPIAPLPSVPSLPSSQPMMILTSAAVPAKPSRTCDEPLPTALNAPPLHQLPAGTSLSQPITTYIQTPYVVVSSTSSHPLSYPLSSTAMLPSNQPTLVTSSSIQQVQKTGVPNSSLQIPLIPVLINTNQTNTSVPSFLQTPCTNVSVVPKPATLIPNILKRTTTASSCTSHQLKSTVSAVPMTTSSEKTNITNGTHIQQAPEVALVSPPAKESPSLCYRTRSGGSIGQVACAE